MEAVKKVLLINIASAKSHQFDLATVNKISQTVKYYQGTPDDQQELIKINEYDLSDNIYSTFFRKEVRQILLKRQTYRIFKRCE
jgi:hypothetical protein